jgi:hypothetical protein
MWKNIVEPYMQQMTVWRIHIALWIFKAINTHTQNMKYFLFFYCNSGVLCWLERSGAEDLGLSCCYRAHLVHRWVQDGGGDRLKSSGRWPIIYLGKHGTVFQAEVYDILACVYENQMNARPGKYIIFALIVRWL